MFSTLSRLLAWPFLIALNIATCVLLLLAALLGTDYGTQQAFSAAQRWLPLEYQSVEGNILNTLSIQGLAYEDASIQLRTESIHWSLNLAALWNSERLLHIQTLQIHNADIYLSATEPSETTAASEPFKPQAIDLPFGIAIDDVSLENVRLHQTDQTYTVEALQLSATASPKGELATQLSLSNGPYNSQAALSATAVMSDSQLTARLAIDSATAEWDSKPIAAAGQLGLNYNGKTFVIDADNVNAHYGSLTLTANGSLADNKTLSLNVNAPDLTLATPELGGSFQLSGDIKNADRINLNATFNNISWLGETQLSKAAVAWQGTLAEQTLNADFSTPLLGQQPVTLTSTFGWRGSFETLFAAMSQPPETLLKQAPLHFTAEATLPQTEIAASGVSLKNNRIGINLSETGEILLSGHSESGKGHLDLNGLVNVINSAQQNIALNATFNGSQYQLANTPELSLSVSPNLRASIADQLLTLRGEVTVDKSYIEIIVPEAGAVTSSSDVVVIETGHTAEDSSVSLARDIDIKLIIAAPITLEGQGFEGTASGQLRVIEKSGKAPRARGELILAGQYKAYGQDLTIRRGKLIYVDSPIDDPGVDMEAIRTVNEQIAGVRVSGLASNPRIEIFAEPALSETEALSYLVLGRGLDDNSEQDQVQLRSLALSLGLAKSGKFLEKSKDKLGVDELSIQTGDSNNEASLLVGRQLSKRLYLSTQIGLFEPVTKLFLRYSLSRKCEFVAETGTQQGADVVCTLKSK